MLSTSRKNRSQWTYALTAEKLSLRASKSKFVPPDSVGAPIVGVSESIRATVSPVSVWVPAVGAVSPSNVSATRTGLSAALFALGSGPPFVVTGSISKTRPVTSSTCGRRYRTANVSTSRIAVQCREPHAVRGSTKSIFVQTRCSPSWMKSGTGGSGSQGRLLSSATSAGALPLFLREAAGPSR